jgi:hypothetical protein
MAGGTAWAAMRYDEIIDVRLLAPSATAVAIVVSIILWLLNQRRKQISWKVLSEGGNSAVVQIINSGHLAVVPGDYHSPMSISAGPGGRVVSAEVVSTVPGDLELRCRALDGTHRPLIERITSGEVLLAPILLNDGDSLVVRLKTEDSRGGVRVNAHINGIRKVSVWRPNTLGSTLLRTVGIFVMVSAVWSIEPTDIARYGLNEALPAILFFLLGYTLLTAGIYGKKLATRAGLEPAV